MALQFLILRFFYFYNNIRLLYDFILFSIYIECKVKFLNLKEKNKLLQKLDKQ